MGKNFLSNLLEKDLLCVGRELGPGRTIITHALNKHLFKKKIDLANRIIYLWSHYCVQRIMKNSLLLVPRYILFGSVQFSSVAQWCPTLCNLMNCSTPGLPVHHQLPEFIQTHVHRVGDAIQPSHPLSSPSPPAPNPSQHQSLFQWVNSSHEVTEVLEFQL